MRGTRKNNFLGGVVFVVLFVLAFGGCKKPLPENNLLPDELHNGFLTLNEGLFQQNNATLTWYSIDQQKTFHHFFETKNQLGLGDTGNDLKIYGEKIYIVVNNSHILHVLDKTTGKLLKQLPLNNNNSGSSPRHITFGGAFAYICAFDGSIFKIDTTGIEIQQIVSAGSNPEDIVYFNGKLFVSNSGGLNYPNMDSTLSVFDAQSMQEIQKITVGKNPGEMVLDDFGNLWLAVRGDESLNEGILVKINPQTFQVENTFKINCSSITAGNGLLYISNYDFASSSSNVVVFDPLQNAVVSANFITDVHFETIYGIQYIAVDGQGILMMNDAKSYINQGSVYAFDLEGNELFSYTSGLNPNCSVYIP